MKAESIRLAYFLFFFLELGWESLIGFLNVRHTRKSAAAVPPGFAAVVDAESWARAAAYNVEKGRFSLVSGLASSFIVLAALFSGGLGELSGFFVSLPLHPYIRGILFVYAAGLFFSLTALPFSLYSQFVIEERYGFNKMTPSLFFLDTVKSLALFAVLGAPLLGALFWFMDAAGSSWWLIAFAFTALFQIFITLLYPLAIAPLFNTFTPLEEGPLKERITTLAAELSFNIKGIFVMDGSRRTRHSNAYFTGLGAVKRVVLFDTLTQSLEAEELAAVLAHEIGHEKKKHLYKRLALNLILLLGFFCAVHILYRYEPLFAAFRFPAVTPEGILVILSFCSGPLTFFLTPLFT
ncbi:MAG: M48 family metallopeptidase, partial [Spirochaetales bacterium]|nr:M48 family metallopeptidase [Spirochaetales bacterium]